MLWSQCNSAANLLRLYVCYLHTHKQIEFFYLLEYVGFMIGFSKFVTTKSKSRYDCSLVCQSVLVSSPFRSPRPDCYYCQLRISWYGVPVLTRGRVCRLQLLLVLAKAVFLGSESRGAHDHILLSKIRDSPNLVGQVSIFIFRRNRVTQLYPQVLSSLFVASHDPLGCGWDIRTSIDTGGNYR
jgi:hypothetical protein